MLLLAADRNGLNIQVAKDLELQRVRVYLAIPPQGKHDVGALPLDHGEESSVFAFDDSAAEEVGHDIVEFAPVIIAEIVINGFGEPRRGHEIVQEGRFVDGMPHHERVHDDLLE